MHDDVNACIFCFVFLHNALCKKTTLLLYTSTVGQHPDNLYSTVSFLFPLLALMHLNLQFFMTAWNSLNSILFLLLIMYLLCVISIINFVEGDYCLQVLFCSFYICTDTGGQNVQYIIIRIYFSKLRFHMLIISWYCPPGTVHFVPLPSCFTTILPTYCTSPCVERIHH